jgi:hypothetical protein
MSMVPINPEKPKKTESGRLIILIIVGLLFLCVLIWGSLGGLAYWAGKRTIEKTATAVRVQATSTHVAAATSRAGFEFIDQFNDNSYGWFTGNTDDETVTAEITIANGVYNWKVAKTKKGFAWGGEKMGGRLFLTDFDAYVDARLNKANVAAPCYGLRFRESPTSATNSYYAFYLCNEQDFLVDYFDGNSNEWTSLRGATNSSAIHANEWNLLGVSARGSHFTFTINDWKVAELDDSRSKSGGVGVFLEADKGQSGSVEFDNFVLQSR